MERTERFRDRSEVRRELQRLNEAREASGARLERHWEALQDRQVRGRLISDAAGDMFHAWKPMRLLSGLAGGASLSGLLGTAFNRGRSWKGRILWSVLGLVLPSVLDRMKDLSMDDISKHVRTSADRIGSYLAERKKHHHERAHDA